MFVSTDHHFYIPNIFSPNGDGINDVITIGVSEVVESILAFSIFDRWGNLVFEFNEALKVIEWDGMFNGKTLNPGVNPSLKSRAIAITNQPEVWLVV